jgi:deazaflavin-dependent oxidoreductase (nitroreductase family)
MNEHVQRALATDRVIDITTIGRKTGRPRRIETWFYRVDDGYFLTGSPGRRGWYANLLANPRFTFHLKESATADLPALADPVTDPTARREILTPILRDLGQPGSIESWMAGSPLVRVVFPGSGE